MNKGSRSGMLVTHAFQCLVVARIRDLVSENLTVPSASALVNVSLLGALEGTSVRREP